MSDAIDYQCGATVHLFADHRGQGEAPLWKGTLAEAVRRVMAMTAEEQQRAKISIREGTVPGTELLGIKEIAELYGRRDFPHPNP